MNILRDLFAAIPTAYLYIVAGVLVLVLLGILDAARYPHSGYDNRVQGSGNPYGGRRSHKGGSGR